MNDSDKIIGWAARHIKAGEVIAIVDLQTGTVSSGNVDLASEGMAHLRKIAGVGLGCYCTTKPPAPTLGEYMASKRQAAQDSALAREGCFGRALKTIRDK